MRTAASIRRKEANTQRAAELIRPLVAEGEFDWRDAACIGYPPDMWFPENTTVEAKAARKICAGCPISAACLDYAYTNGLEYGIWAGMSREQRRKARGLEETA